MKDTLFHFSCFNAVHQDDSSVGLMGGQLRIPGSLLRKHVFDPVVNQVRFYRSILYCTTRRTTGPYLDWGTNEQGGRAYSCAPPCGRVRRK